MFTETLALENGIAIKPQPDADANNDEDRHCHH